MTEPMPIERERIGDFVYLTFRLPWGASPAKVTIRADAITAIEPKGEGEVWLAHSNGTGTTVASTRKRVLEAIVHGLGR